MRSESKNVGTGLLSSLCGSDQICNGSRKFRQLHTLLPGVTLALFDARNTHSWVGAGLLAEVWSSARWLVGTSVSQWRIRANYESDASMSGASVPWPM